MKTKLTLIGAALVVLSAVILLPLKVSALAGCTAYIDAMNCPGGGGSPVSWMLTDKNFHYKPWPFYWQAVPVEDGDIITLSYSSSCCAGSGYQSPVLDLYYTLVPYDGVHIAQYSLSYHTAGGQWRVTANCTTGTFSLVPVYWFPCGEQQ